MQVNISQGVWVRQQKKIEIIQFDKLLAGLKKVQPVLEIMNLVQASKQTQSSQVSKAKSKKKINKTVA